MTDDEFPKQSAGTGESFRKANLDAEEIIKHHYPDIDRQDSLTLEKVFWTARDLCVPDYIEVVMRLTGYPLFLNQSRAKEKIEELLSRGLVIKKIVPVTYGCGDRQFIRDEPCIYLQPALENELIKEIM